MNLGFDAKRIYHNFTGLGNYSRDTVRILVENFANHHYFLFNPRKVKSSDFMNSVSGVTEINPASNNKLMQSLWRTLFVKKDINAHQLDIYHGLSNELPLNLKSGKTKTIVTIHDLLFIRYPNLYAYFDRSAYTFKYKRSCQIADSIIAISEQTKADIIKYFKIDPEKIKVIYQGCHPLFKQTVSDIEKERVKNKYQLPDNFVLFVGSVEERKNMLTVVKSIRKSEHISLVMVGRSTDYTKKIRSYINANQMNHRIWHIEKINMNDLVTLYQMARIFVYPSLFEGFGIPIIEALNSGTPVITSTGGCFPEAGGKGSFYVNSTDTEEWKNTIEMLWDDEDKRKDAVKKGYLHVQKFDDKVIASNLINLYTSVLN